MMNLMEKRERTRGMACKAKYLALVCFKVNLVIVPKDTWWVDSGATTHISQMMMKDSYLWLTTKRLWWRL